MKFGRLRAKLREKLDRKEIIVAPGVHDALSARAVEKAGFETIYMSGHGTGAGMLAWTDVGLTTMTEMVWNLKHICNAINVPVISDMDTGYGNAVNVLRTVREYEQAGAAGFHIEDQVFPKKCGFMKGKALISMEEMIGKIKACVEARDDPNMIIIARCDARAVEGSEAMYRRCNAYAKAGADVIFAEAPLTLEEIKQDPKRIDAPCLLNGLRAGLSIEEVAEFGYAIVIMAGLAWSVAPKAVYDAAMEVMKTRRYPDFAKEGKAFPSDVLQELIRLPEVSEAEQKFLPEEIRLERWGTKKVPSTREYYQRREVP